MKRSRSIEIYLKKGLEEDDHIYDIWKILQKSGRPQDSFRRALKIGLSIMADNAELPRAVRNIFDHDVIPGVDLSLYMETKKTKRKGQSQIDYEIESGLRNEPYRRYNGQIDDLKVKKENKKRPVESGEIEEEIEIKENNIKNENDVSEDEILIDFIQDEEKPQKKMKRFMG